jgi:L-seryl-tRNA(Ser) seleniumtransferase
MNAIGDNTALIFGLPRHVALSGTMAEEVLQPEDLIQVAKQVGVPVMIDGASRLPPAGNLTIFNELGADLVVVSGGKGLRGPQSTGILSGRPDLIEAARLQAAPNDLIGRGMKVGKEEIIGLIVALNRYEQLDHGAVRATWREKAEYLTAELQGIESFTAEFVDEGSGAPYVEIDWDEDVIPMTHREVRNHLRRRPEQRVALSSLYGSRRIQTRCMRDGEEVLVARWLRQFFTEGYKSVAATSASL